MKNSAFIKLASEEDSSYVDIYTTYGVSFLKGSYYKMIKRGSSKGYTSNESRLTDGIQYLAKPSFAKYSKKAFSVEILLEASSMSDYVSKIESFTDKISSGLFFLKIPSRFRVFKLVYTDMKEKQEFRNGKAIFTLDLEEPNPRDRIVLT